MRFVKWLDEMTHKITVGDIIAYHCRGYVKAKVVSWQDGRETIYYQGELTTFRELKWKYKGKLYKQRVYVVDAENDYIVVQIWKENLKLKKILDEQLKGERK